MSDEEAKCRAVAALLGWKVSDANKNWGLLIRPKPFPRSLVFTSWEHATRMMQAGKYVKAESPVFDYGIDA